MTTRRQRIVCSGLLMGFSIMLSSCTTTVKPTERRMITNAEAREARLKDGKPIEEVLAERLEQEPDNPKWYFELGLEHERRQEFGRAEELYREGAKLLDTTRFTGPNFFIARTLVKRGKQDEAIPLLQRVLQVTTPSEEDRIRNPHYREAHYLLGVLYHQRERPALAEGHLRQFVRLGGEKQRVAPYAPHLLADGLTPQPK